MFCLKTMLESITFFHRQKWGSMSFLHVFAVLTAGCQFFIVVPIGIHTKKLVISRINRTYHQAMCVNLAIMWGHHCSILCQYSTFKASWLDQNPQKPTDSGLSENRVYSQWNSHLIGTMISKTIGFRDTLFSDTPIHHGSQLETYCLAGR